MKQMSHIVFIIPSLQQGGLENHVTVLANQIAKDNNLKVSIICYYNNPVFYEVNENIDVYFPSYSRKGHSTFHYYLKSFLFIRKTLKSIKPDKVISFGDFINAISILVAKSLSLFVFIGDRSSPGKNFPTFINLLRKLTYPKANGIIAQTHRAKKQKGEMVGLKVPIEVIPNPLRAISSFNDQKKNVVLCVARHYHVKGIDRLIEAFANTTDKTWQIEVAGSEGPETKKLKEQAAQLKISDRVVFLGARKDMDKIYSYSSIFVLPSRSEGLPNALIEAMAHGLPSIAFDINAGPSDVIKHEINGILIQDGDIKELTKQLDRLMMDENRRTELGNKAIEIKEKHSLERITSIFLNFIDS